MAERVLLVLLTPMPVDQFVRLANAIADVEPDAKVRGDIEGNCEVFVIENADS